jgi:hypothetical protein
MMTESHDNKDETCNIEDEDDIDLCLVRLHDRH